MQPHAKSFFMKLIAQGEPDFFLLFEIVLLKICNFCLKIENLYNFIYTEEFDIRKSNFGKPADDRI